MILRACAALLVFSLTWMVTCANAENPFKGQTLNYIVATKAGGGYDTMGRLVSKYLEKHLEAEVRVKNVPGAGHAIGALEILQAKDDGLTIGTFNTGLILAQIIGDVPEQLDLAKFNWIGKAATEARVLVVRHDSPFTGVDDLIKAGRQIRMAASGKRTASYFESKFLGKALGIDVKVIPGFEGPEQELSLLRGEIDAILVSRSSVEPLVESKQCRIILEFGGNAQSTAPRARDIITSDIGKSIVNFIESQAELSRLTAGPPDMSPDRLEALRTAYMNVMNDAAFLEEAKKLDLPIASLPGDQVDKMIRQVFAMPQEQMETIKSLLKE